MHFFGGGSMGAGEVECVGVVLAKQGLEMGQSVVFTKHTRHIVFKLGIIGVELVRLQFGKFINQLLGDNEMLITVTTWRFVLLVTKAWLQELCHLEMGITQQRWQTDYWY